MDGRDPGKRKVGETSKQGTGGKKAREGDAFAVVKSTDAIEVGEVSRGSTDDASRTAGGGDGASSVDTSLTLDIGATATATRVWWRNSQRGGQQVSAKSECDCNSDAAVVAYALSDGHSIPAVRDQCQLTAVEAAPSTGSSRNDPDFQVSEDESCPACAVDMGLPADHPTYHSVPHPRR